MRRSPPADRVFAPVAHGESGTASSEDAFGNFYNPENNAFVFPEIVLYCTHPASLGRGVARDRHDTRGGERWPRASRSVSERMRGRTVRRGREVAACWHPDAGATFVTALARRAGNGGQQARRTRQTAYKREDHRAGKAGRFSAAPVVPAACIFSRRRAAGVSRRLAFPAPSELREGEMSGMTRRERRARMKTLVCWDRRGRVTFDRHPRAGGDPVRRGLSRTHHGRGVLGRPVKPGDDNGASRASAAHDDLTRARPTSRSCNECPWSR